MENKTPLHEFAETLERLLSDYANLEVTYYRDPFTGEWVPVVSVK